MALVLIVVLLIGSYMLYRYLLQRTRLAELAKFIGGPKPDPILGNSLLFVGKDVPGIFHTVLELHKEYGQDLITHGLFGDFQLHVSSAKTIERILLAKNTKKNYIYGFLEPWLGSGLLLSSGEKWFQRRRIITPTFHFKILDQFLDVFNAETDRLVEKLRKHAVAGDEFNVYNYITLHALDSICETSMGVGINALDNPDNAYVNAVKGMGEIIISRTFSLLRSYPSLYPLYPSFWRQRKLIKTMHEFTNSVIQSKRRKLEQNLTQGAETSRDAADDEMYGKKRMSFLDLLLHESSLSDADIREEVDTFMFEGHDTTTSGIFFSLMALIHHPDVQQRLYEEIVGVLGGAGKHSALTNAQLQEMKYLDMVIKEVLRFYPPVPIIGRELLEDTEINGAKIPRGTAMIVVIYNVHRNPEVFPDPDRFDPERFSDANAHPRGPYDYIPFSIGARNCIGQKYAIMEMKVTLVKLLACYKFLPCNSHEPLKFQGDLVLRPAGNVSLRVESRA